MLPSSNTNRYILVGAGKAHVRTVKTTVDPMEVPIVEHMTLKKIGKKTARQISMWKAEAIKAINNVPEKSDQATLDAFYKPSPATTSVSHRRHTREANSPVKQAVAGSSSKDAPTPDSTPGKWFGLKKPAASRKRDQARTGKAIAKLSLAEYHA